MKWPNYEITHEDPNGRFIVIHDFVDGSIKTLINTKLPTGRYQFQYEEKKPRNGKEKTDQKVEVDLSRPITHRTSFFRHRGS